MATDFSAFSERLCAYIKASGGSVRAFERSIGVSNGWVSDVKSKVDINVVSEISRKYPDLNIRWLFSGEGEMLRGGELEDLCERLVSIHEMRDGVMKELAETLKAKKA